MYALLIALSILVVLTCPVADGRITPPMVTAVGTPYEVGHQVGAAAKSRISSRLRDPDLKGALHFAFNTTRGQKQLAQLIRATKRDFPHLLDEIRGISHGAGVAFDEAFVLNAGQELASYQNRTSSHATSLPPGHCTDVWAIAADRNDSHVVWGHNEDGSKYGRGTIVYTNITVTLPHEGNRTVSFQCIAYPGTVCANAFGWNSHGLALSFNAVFPTQDWFTRAPVNVYTRALMELRSPEEVVAFVARKDCSYGFNANVGFTHRPHEIFNVEYDPLGQMSKRSGTSPFSEEVSAQTLRDGVSTPPRYGYHTNIYLSLQTQCFPDPSSIHRLRTLHTRFSPPNTTHDVRQMLGDTSDPDYPVYRNGTHDDPGQTISTAVFDLAAKSVEVWWDANPKLETATFKWMLW